MYAILVQAAFEGVVEASEATSELRFEGIVEALDGLGEGGCLSLVVVLLTEALAVVEGILVAAGGDVGGGVGGVLRVTDEDRILIEDEDSGSIDRELTAVGLDKFGFLDGEGFHTFDLSLDGFLLGTQGIERCEVLGG